ncbi:MAG TPA: sigma-70 family RNA polymerase sigma factor, partial [Gemmatimonadaceae bacterium]|nr:sigma-70 family RNA polymerase sigma factor [Gemmatimonadaceae bacterium]
MPDHELLAAQFERNRDRLRGVAFRMLGSSLEADDAVQEAWLRVTRADANAIDNLPGWLTTVVARVCLDMLRTRRARGEESLGAHEPAPGDGRRHERTPEQDALLADAVGTALLVVLDTLAPAERVAFVLHDMFDLSFDEIAPIVDRSPVAARQLASRARRRVRGAPAPTADRLRQRQLVDAFIAASKAGDFEALVSVLAPDVEFRCDAKARKMGGPADMRGAVAVAKTFAGRAQVAKPGLVNGEPAIIVDP